MPLRLDGWRRRVGPRSLSLLGIGALTRTIRQLWDRRSHVLDDVAAIGRERA